MKNTTLCYIEKDDKYLMLYRNKKKIDVNGGKWVGVGGKFEEGETPGECLVREVYEETGLVLTGYIYHGLIRFESDKWETENMFLFTGTEYDGEINPECSEGELKWIDKDKIMNLPMWAGDRIFLERMLESDRDINLTLRYEGERLAEVKENDMSKWVTIFGNAPSMTEWKPEQYSKNITLAYPVTVPFYGEALKLKFSNKYGTDNVIINGFSVLSGEKTVYVSQTEIKMEPGEEKLTEDFEVCVSQGNKIEVRFYIKDFTNMSSAVYTCGKYSGGKCMEGKALEGKLDIDKTVDTNWNYFLTDVIMKTDNDNHAIICYGDSITAQDWPDELYDLFLKNPENHTAIVRKAVSGTRLLRQYDCNKYRSYGIKGDTRFPHETDVEGADTVLIQHGINDIIHPVGTEVNAFRPWSDLPTVSEMTACIERYISVAREKGLKVYLGTLLPIKGWRTYADFREKIKNEFNEWMRSFEGVDGIIDFDKAVCDSEDVTAFSKGYDSGDHLHPSKAAYKRMGQEAYNVLK